jgi:hypothetical protein
MGAGVGVALGEDAAVGVAFAVAIGAEAGAHALITRRKTAVRPKPMAVRPEGPPLGVVGDVSLATAD